MDTRHASIGIVVTNVLEKLLHMHGSPIQFMKKVMTAEPLVIRMSLECAIKNGWKKVENLLDANRVDRYDPKKKVTTLWEIEVTC